LAALEGRATLVTGAASGIGLAVARLACTRGARVMVTDLQQSAIDQAVQGISADTGGAVVGQVLEVQPESVLWSGTTGLIPE